MSPALSARLFLLAYTCSGAAGLIYQVSWTRLLTLYIGHTTAAASAVVAAFLGGLAIGAAMGGAIAPRLSPRNSLIAYAVLEIAVIGVALLLPYELAALRPLLQWAYADGASGVLFPAMRLLSCLVMVFVPAAALGATFPLAIRWFATESDNRARSTSALYALNTTGAAIGALLAGFVLIPRIGLTGTTRVGMAASAVAAISALVLTGLKPGPSRDTGGNTAERAATRVRNNPSREVRRGAGLQPGRSGTPSPWIALLVLGISGFAALVHEIVWTRILTLVLGPTIYAFAATLAAVVAGVAIGSGLGTWLVARTRQPVVWLSLSLAIAAIATAWTSALAGGEIPRLVARHMATTPDAFGILLWRGMVLTAGLVIPTAALVGAAFPLALTVVDDAAHSAPRRFAMVFAINTLGAVAGSLAAGFWLIPQFGLQGTLTIVSVCLIAAALIAALRGRVSRIGRVAGVLASTVAFVMLVVAPPWDRELLASGVYVYAPFVPKDLDLETLLKAGTLLYYREGAASTVSVKRLTGTTTLAVDGKTDASNRSDMLTQKLIAHLPLLLHDNPREVAIIGLGSGVTVGAALRHPITRADVIEISPQVVEASAHFTIENQHALADLRTNLIVGDGRSHLLLSKRQYDVIISEPSNPWIAGVASLFTREFFVAARDRLAPSGIICQWANAYNISESDLRAIVATFTAVFPEGTAWLVGGDDVLLVASTTALDERLGSLERHWDRPGVAPDLAGVGALEPFALWSLFVGGPAELSGYVAGADILTDDRMTLEFSTPREIHRRDAGQNGDRLAALVDVHRGPAIIEHARKVATAAQWRNRGEMMAKRDAHAIAYADYMRALMLDPESSDALEGFVRTAILTRRSADALGWIRSSAVGSRPTPQALIAISKLLAARGSSAEAIDAARQATDIEPVRPAAFEQLASLYADAGDIAQLGTSVSALRNIAPERAGTYYYAAVSAFLRDDAAEALRLCERATKVDPGYAPVYDLMGAAYTKLGDGASARAAFQTSLRFDAHDSTAYANLGLLELAAGNHDAARRYFAESLWLESDSTTAREGLRQTSSRR